MGEDFTGWVEDAWGVGDTSNFAGSGPAPTTDVWGVGGIGDYSGGDAAQDSPFSFLGGSNPFLNPMASDGFQAFAGGDKPSTSEFMSRAPFGYTGPSEAAYAPTGPAAYQPGVLGQIMQALGVQDKQGKTDLSNPKTLDAVMRSVLGGANVLNALLGRNVAKGYKTPQEMLAMNKSPYGNFTPTQQQWVDKYFNTSTPAAAGTRQRISAAAMPSSIVPSRGYAEGGNVSPGALTLIAGPGGGQDDLVDASLSPGEYVWDADVVSALGDGNNEHGARILDATRERIRAHKRSAPAHSIPPKAKPLEHYMPKGALTSMKGAK